MRALHLLKTSAGAIWAFRQMRELVRLGVDVHVALPSGPLVPKYEEAGIRTYPALFDLPVRRPETWPGLFREFRALVGRIRPDVIHSHFVGTTLTMRLALGRRRGIPRLFQVPGPLHLEHPLFRTCEIATSGPGDFWAGACRWTRNRYLRSGLAPGRVFLSYYGLDLEEFAPAEPGKLRGERGLGGRVKIVGMVSYIYPPKRYLGQTRGLKGHEDLIDALVLVRRHYPDIVGVFVGGTWGGDDRYERRVRSYGRRCLGDRAIFLGTRGDVVDLYADFDVAAHPSHSENVGGAGESLLLAVPTVATKVGGFPDVVLPGETGWLVSPRRPVELAGALLEALDRPLEARRMAEQGRKRVRELLDVRRTAAGIRGVYDEILSR